jgi:hypothetical protein
MKRSPMIERVEKNLTDLDLEKDALLDSYILNIAGETGALVVLVFFFIMILRDCT